MFTGLVTDLGQVVSATRREGGLALVLRTRYALDAVEIGASIAVNGVCLTVERKDGDTFTVTAGPETLALTTTGALRAGDRVHLEQALRLGDRLGGHLVQGHVDGVGRLLSTRLDGGSWELWLEAPRALARYIVTKGSICVDGVSLTVNEVDGARFRVNIIPHTAASTRLAALRPQDPVNLEVDLLARYVERLLGAHDSPLTFERLRALGYGGKET